MNRPGPEVVWSLHPVGDAQLSPDGQNVVWVQEEADPKKNRMTCRLWIGSTGDKKARPLTGPGHRDRFPRWSPVGRKIAFVSDRGGKDRLYLIPADGGEAEPIVTDCMPMGAPDWSPDGTKLTFAAMVEDVPSDALMYPGAPSEVEEEIAPPADERPMVVTDLMFKFDGVGLLGSRAVQVCVVPAASTPQDKPVPAHRLTSGRHMNVNPRWSPDGRRIAFASTRHGDASSLMDTRVYIAKACGGGEPQLVYGGDMPCDRPEWSPDGKRLAFVAPDAVDWGTSSTRIYLVDVSGGLPASEARCITSGLDRPVGGAVPSDTRHQPPDRMLPIIWGEAGIYGTVAAEGSSHIFRFDPTGSEPPVRVTPGEERAVGSLSLAAGKLAYVAATGYSPDEVYVLDDRGETRVSRANLITGVSWHRPERLEFSGPDDWRIEGWYLPPVGSQQRPPMILSIHGGPSGMYGHGFSVLFQILSFAGYSVLYVNPRGSQGYGGEFARAVRHDWGGKDFGDLMAAVDAAVERGWGDPDRLGVTGWSYGGYMSCWTVGHTDRFRAAVAGACVSNLISEAGQSDIGAGFVGFSIGAVPGGGDWSEIEFRSPLKYADRVKTPVLFVHGESDQRCPIGQSEEMYAALCERGVPTALIRYPGEPHALGRPHNRVDRYRRTVAWFDRHVGSS